MRSRSEAGRPSSQHAGRARVPGGGGTTVRDLPTIRESLARMRRTALLLRPYWGRYAGLIGLGLVLGAIGLVGPLLTKLLIDGVYPTGDITLLQLLVGAIFVHSVVSALVSSVRGYYTRVVSARLQADTSVFLVNHLHHLPLRFFERMPVGDILSRFGDLRSSLRSVASLFDLVFLRGVYLVLIPPVLFVMSWPLALVAFATVPLTSAVNVGVARALRRRWKAVAEAGAELQAINVETVSHIRLLKGMGLERESFRRTVAAATAARDQGIAVARLSVLLGVANTLVRTAGTAAFTYVGWRLVVGSGLTLGSFLAFTAYLAMVRRPLAEATSLISRFQQTAVMLDRIFEVLEEATEADPLRLYDPAYAPAAIAFDGSIRLENVRFEYPDGAFTLSVPDLEFPASAVTGIVGTSGSGKSTLLRLLAAIEAPSHGTIWYGARRHDELPLDARRRSVAVAWQNPELLRGSLRTNLVVGIDDASEADLERVIEVCRLGDFVASLPEGLDTPVSEWGATLSGGQQQRLSLARALARRAPVVLLDEITSNLDPETEELVMQGLGTYLRGTTVVLVSHRPSTIQHVDRVVEMSAGRASLRRSAPRRKSSSPGAAEPAWSGAHLTDPAAPSTMKRG